MAFTVDRLITDVRTQTDEANTTTISDAKILSALNRGQRKAANLIARRYDSLFITPDTSISTTAGTQAYDLPAGTLGRRIEKVEVYQNVDTPWEVKRISFQKTSNFSTSTSVDRPYYYALTKNKIRLYPAPKGGLTVRVWILQKPEELVKSQGRITAYSDSTTDTVTLDALGSDLTTDTADGFNAYANVIDYQTGEIKGTLQISAINTSTKVVTFKSSGLTRSTVLGRTVATTLPTDIAEDDFLSIVTGTCVPELPEAYSDYLVAFATTEIRRGLGEDTEEDYANLKEQETELSKMWSGREMSHRVRKSNGQWGRGIGTVLRQLLT